jgi:hypothetical protein
MGCTIIRGVFHSDISFSCWFFKILQPLLSKCALVHFLSGDSPVSEFCVPKHQHIKFRCWGITQKKESIFRTWQKTDFKNKYAPLNYFHCITDRLGFLNYRRAQSRIFLQKTCCCRSLSAAPRPTDLISGLSMSVTWEDPSHFHLMPQNNWNWSFHFFISQIVDDLLLC